MSMFTRRSLLQLGLVGASALQWRNNAFALSASLQDIGSVSMGSPEATIYTAKEIVTLDPAKPITQAVAVVNGRILWSGSLDEVKKVLGDQPHKVDSTFADHVIVPGFIAQHDHPVLAALTMSSVILSIEDWVLPHGTIPAVKDKREFMQRLSDAVKANTKPDEPVLTWGYHAAFFGPLTRADLDTVSDKTPILVWGRSCHEMTLNSAALSRGGVTTEMVNGWADSAKSQSNLQTGRFWEQGLFAVLPHIAEMAASPARLIAGLELTRDYMHAKGVTIGNEPGGIQSKSVQDAVNSVFSSPNMPFRWSFMADAKSLVAKYADDVQVITETEKLAFWYGGMTSLAKKQVKLFSDGAVYSLAMQLRDPYIGNYHGEWMMDLPVFERAFQVYWDAGYQIHIHVTGDAGVDRILDTLESNLRRNPRYNHRTVLVHFPVSAPDQVPRIKALGAIVSGNPYYVSALADQYTKEGLGPERANEMVRLGDLKRAGVSFSLHSDMPMAPGDPLFLMWCAVNRITTSGRIAGPEQRISAEDALRGVTIEAAYSLKLENEIGSIVPGKRANLTVLNANPLSVDPMAIKDIKVWGTVMEGRMLPVGYLKKRAFVEPSGGASRQQFANDALHHAFKVAHADSQ